MPSSLGQFTSSASFLNLKVQVWEYLYSEAKVSIEGGLRIQKYGGTGVWEGARAERDEAWSCLREHR